MNGRFIPIGTNTSKFDLNVPLHEQGGRLSGTLEYNTDLFDRTTIRRILAHFETLLEAVAGDAEQRVSELPLLTPAERQAIVQLERHRARVPGGVGGRPVRAPRGRGSRRIPGGRVWRPDPQLRELNRRVNRLAHHLRALGM